MKIPNGFTTHALDQKHVFYGGTLPASLMPSEVDFEIMWDMHPKDYHLIMMKGKEVRTPRWQQAYGRDYHYTGRLNKALPVTERLGAYLTWCQDKIDARLNGILLNWYDASQGHYIGRHRDSTKGMVPDSPIVTISLGEERVFRLRPWKGKGFTDFEAIHGRVFIMPHDTNLAWTHEIPAGKKWSQRRISITLRAFDEAVSQA